jgi:hypothetical protein
MHPKPSRTHRKTLVAFICLATIGLGASRMHPPAAPTRQASCDALVSVHYIPSGSPAYTPRQDDTRSCAY